MPEKTSHEKAGDESSCFDSARGQTFRSGACASETGTLTGARELRSVPGVNNLSRYSGWAYAVMRIIVGLLFATHGAQKAFGMFGGKAASAGHMIFAGWVELLGGLLIALGLLTRPAAFLASGLMAVAYFMAHAPGGWHPVINKGELAVVYCFLFLYMFFRGSGPLALDNLIFRNRSGTNDLGATVASRR